MGVRELIFKAKRMDNGEWVEGLVTIMWGQYHIINPMDENTAYPIDTETICQYTGLTDKNGNKIWENDICYNVIDKCVICYGIYDNNSYCEEHMGFYINWEKLKNKYRQDIGYWTSEIEVIGNIFDNPELLEDE